MVESVAGGLIVAALVTLSAYTYRRAKRRLRTQHPVGVTVQRIVREPWALAFAGALSESTGIEGSSISSAEANAELRARGGVDVGQTRLRLQLRGTAAETVVVRNIKVHLRRDPPVDGVRVFCPSAGASAATLLIVDFDAPDPSAWEFEEDEVVQRVGAAPFFDTNNITLAPGEVYDVILVGTTKRWCCSWRLLLHVEVGDKRVVVPVDDSGEPFQTTGEPEEGFSQKLLWAWWEGGRLIPDDEPL